MLSEQQINTEQLSLQCNEAVAQTRQLEQIVEEACRHVPELEIATELPVGMQIHKLASGFCKAMEEATRIQLDLNL